MGVSLLLICHRVNVNKNPFIMSLTTFHIPQDMVLLTMGGLTAMPDSHISTKHFPTSLWTAVMEYAMENCSAFRFMGNG